MGRPRKIRELDPGDKFTVGGKVYTRCTHGKHKGMCVDDQGNERSFPVTQIVQTWGEYKKLPRESEEDQMLQQEEPKSPIEELLGGS